MIYIKKEKEIKGMKEGGKILKKVFKKIDGLIRPNVSTKFINREIESEILRLSALPGFKTVNNYSYASCISINEQVVHTRPSERVILKGDLVTVDIGVLFKGLHTDSANTYIVGGTEDKVKITFLEAGQRALKNAIEKARVGNRIGHISGAIEQTISRAGYKTIRQLTGHGVGKSLHEDPAIPGFMDKPVKKTSLLKKGMTLAIEVIYAVSTDEIECEPDGWSLRTIDKSLSACFEHTVLIDEDDTIILA